MPEPLDAEALDALLALTGGDAGLYAELLDAFLGDATLYMAELEAAIGSGADDELLRPAHSLKSNAMSIGATRLTDLCRDLEADARSGAVPAARGRVGAIRTELDVVIGAVRTARREAVGDA
ncbi:MAG: Hpt domain-containing protein [Candidatus Limnocylindria bacterium]